MSRDTFTFSNLVVARKIDDSLISASQACQRSHAGQMPNTPDHKEEMTPARTMGEEQFRNDVVTNISRLGKV